MYQLSLASSRSHAQNRKLFTALTKLPKCEYYMPWGSWKCPRKWVSLLFGVNPLIFADFGHMQKIGFQQVTGPVPNLGWPAAAQPASAMQQKPSSRGRGTSTTRGTRPHAVARAHACSAQARIRDCHSADDVVYGRPRLRHTWRWMMSLMTRMQRSALWLHVY